MLNRHFNLRHASALFERKVLGTTWQVIASLLIALSWLLPNHYVPWSTFHTDAMMAVGLTLIASWVVLTTLRIPSDWHWSSFAIAMIALIPIIQYAVGLIPFWGVAWINSAYLIGLLLSLLVGQKWEKLSPDECFDVIFLAVGIGSLVSMYIALHQLLRLESLELWVMQMNSPRVGANLGQPNQLASLLALGMLASCWAYIRGRMSGLIATVLAGFFLLGVAITQSRTGWLNVTILLVMMQFWALRSKSKSISAASIMLALFFVICILGVTPFIDWIMSEHSTLLDGRLDIGQRPLAWKLFSDALQQRPVWGFGWGQIAIAQFQMATRYPYLGGIFFHSHNFFLDLALWNGLPIALIITAAIMWCCVIAGRRIKNAGDFVCLLFLAVLGIHAMLEFPLHYAYFLLPFGLIAGAVTARLQLTPAVTWSGWSLLAVLSLTTAVLAVTIHDYLLVETSFNQLRFEKARIGRAKDSRPPEVFVLTQLREMIRFARVDPYAKFQPNELNGMRQIVQAMPSSYAMQKLATALAINGEPKEAGVWMERLCRTSPTDQCDNARNSWSQQASKYVAIAAVGWPTDKRK